MSSHARKIRRYPLYVHRLRRLAAGCKLLSLSHGRNELNRVSPEPTELPTQEVYLPKSTKMRLILADQQNVVIEISCLPHILLAKAGIPHIRFHDLRHSTATLLLTLGVHPKVVQELLGHSQIFVTLDIYSHILPTLQEQAMHHLNRFLTSSDLGERRASDAYMPPAYL